MTVRTKEKLARVCEAEGLHDMARLARLGRYDDFESESATPQIDLHNAFIRHKRKDLAKRVAAGEWESTREESEAWAQSPEGQATIAELGMPKDRVPYQDAMNIERTLKTAPGSPADLTPERRRVLEDIAQAIAQRIGGALEGNPEGVLFAFMLFTAGAGGFSTYVSNAQRADMVKALREQADVLERGLDSPPIRQQQ